MNISRRHFLGSAAAVTLGFGGLHTLFRNTGYAAPDPRLIAEGYGPLQPDPEGIFELPEGFQYKIISRVGDTMDDGLLVPGSPDGMATFIGKEDRCVLIRNHELSNDAAHKGAYGPKNEHLNLLASEAFYDYGNGELPSLGGTSTVIFNTKTGEVERQFMSLAGTGRNCAGGPTPWGSWISCEETVQRVDDTHERDHGYCFEVPASLESCLLRPQPIKDMGRFNHEAIAVDPKSGAVYQTEDRHDGLIYRYLPDTPGKLLDGGRLQALMIKERPSFDTRNWGRDAGNIVPGDRFETEWIDLEDIDNPEDDMRQRGFAAGAARFARGEGMWYGDDSIYFACTNGGYAEKGQIWRYFPSPAEGSEGEASAPGKLELFVEPNAGGLIDNADNLTVAPWGDIVVCEDGSGEQFMVGVQPDGKIYKLGRNATAGNSELAGSTFSPDGSTLFVNIQNDGLTLAITGPWKSA